MVVADWAATTYRTTDRCDRMGREGKGMNEMNGWMDGRYLKAGKSLRGLFGEYGTALGT